MNSKQETNQYVIFKLDEEYFGIAINYVKTIERVLEITRLPNAPHHIKGVINLRGEVIPVIDARLRFSMKKREITEESRIIILSIEEITIGLLVDSSSEVLTIENHEIDNTNNLINHSEDNYIKGIGKKDNRMIIIIDVIKVLEQED